MMRTRVASMIFRSIRKIPTKLGVFKVSACVIPMPVYRYFTAVITYQRAIVASLFPMWFLVHASPIEEQKETVQNKKKLIEQADALYEEMKYEEIYDLLHLDDLLDDDEILWRLARVMYEISITSPSKERAKSLGEEALKCIKRAIEVNDNNHNAHRWYAIVLDHAANMNGTKERLIKSRECREHMEKATTICNTDATSHYMIGVWCYTFADLPWYTRKMASIIFTSPPESSFEEALIYFEKAEELQPNFYSKNLLMLGKTYLKLNDKEKAISFLQRTKNYPLKTREDHEAFKEADDLLKSLKIK